MSAAGRVCLSTFALCAVAAAVFVLTDLHMVSGYWVLILAGTGGLAYFVSLVLFDDGTVT